MGRKHFGIILFAAVWLVVLSVPTLRLMWRMQVRGDGAHRMMMGKPPRRLSDWLHQEKSLLLKELPRRYPNDVRVLAKMAEEADGRRTVLNYDRLLRRFPNNAWLVANRLRHTASWFRDDRVAGDPQTMPSTPPPQQKNFTAAELAQAIAVARKGRQLEPDNSYFDWTLASFLFAAHRDAEALAVLHEGAQKPRYDDCTLQDTQASIAVRELVRPLLFEEKWSVFAALLFPHFAQHRRVARLAIWEGVKAERAGDHQRALQIYGDVARLGARMRESSHCLIQSLVAIAIETTAWQGLERKLTKDEEKQLLAQRNYLPERTRIAARRFAAYAAAHGRADLAEEVRRNGEAVARFREGRHFPTDIIVGFPNWKFAWVLALWWASVALLPQLLLTAFVWGILSVVLWRKQVFSGSIHPLDIASSV
ncbi:MAG: hypothetical protein NZT92_19910, partial [Abditibacteriales bacterium]|nr:hypothetical protein [Abditibacteriales bacterium]MDW8367980.1 hypothetical protein [Abditibacteriales bacterium]